jgi:glycosyltransferase involved in cell wall biosynthesis
MRDARCPGAVSVVIPCYNASGFIGAALDSILGQSQPPEQVIVVDDGSSDGSAEVVGRYAALVSYLRQDNQGISAARNRGIAHADRDLIAFLDADDLWPPDSLALRCAALANDHNLSCVFGQIEQFAERDFALPAARPGRLVGAMLARRAVFDRIGVFDPGLRIGETLDWVARLDESGLRSHMLDAVVLRRRIHASNTVHDRANQIDYLKAVRAALHRRRGTAGAA